MGWMRSSSHERERSATPLAPGPFKPLLEALHRLQRTPPRDMRIRTALVTARSAPAHERAIRTLMDWHIEVDEAMFLGGLPKGEFLREFEPDFFFDDQTGHVDGCRAARAVGARGRRHRQPAELGRSLAGSRRGAVSAAARSPPGRARARRRTRRGSAARACSARSASFTRWRDSPTR